MNRLVDYLQPDSIDNTRFDNSQLELRYESDEKIRIGKKDIDSGQELIIIPFVNNDGLMFPVLVDTEWIIDLAQTTINEVGFVGGVLDGLGMVTESIYHIWAFADNTGQSKGFGLLQQPTSTFQCASTAKGAEITLTNLTKGFRFALGARLQVLHNNVTTAVNDLDWNLATITSIDSATQIKAVLDNNKVFGQTYGATIPVQGSTGGLITQLDKFRPYASDDSTQTTIETYYRIIGILKTDNTASPNTVIDGFEALPNHDFTPVNTRIVWDGTLTNFPPLLTDDWLFTDGLRVKIDRSRLIGQVTPTIVAPSQIIKVR